MKQSAAIGPSPVGRICAFLALSLLLLIGCSSASLNEHWDRLEEIADLSEGEVGLIVYPGLKEYMSGERANWKGKVAEADLPPGFWDFRSCQVSRIGSDLGIVATFDFKGGKIVLLRSGEINGRSLAGLIYSDRLFAYTDAETVRALRAFLMRNVDPKWHGAIASIKATDKPCLNR